MVQNSLPQEWVVRIEPQETDYGIDMEIELADLEVSGRLFKVQVRGHANVPWTAAGTFLQPVREETLNYWRAIPLPVVMMVPDHSAGLVYWAPAKPAEATGVRIEQKHSLPADADSLSDYIINWIDRRSSRALKYGLPFFETAWRRVLESVGFDFFMAMDYEAFTLLDYVYRQTQLVREALGLSSNFLPWSLWIARARVTFGDDEDMYWGTADEIVAYLIPFVEEALCKGREELLREEPSPENAAAQYWAEDYGVRWVTPTQFDSLSSAEWDQVDKLLTRLGVRQHNAAEAAERRASRI